MAQIDPESDNQPLVEVDDEAFETDSAYGNELSTYTVSLTSSVMEFRQENGRRYHGYRDGRYLIPNDELESDRLDMAHEMTLTIMGRKLFLAPVDSSCHRVLDLCTGTGIWAIDFADKFPSAEVIGNDLSPTQPEMVPPNLKFQVDDVEDQWTHPIDHFDFIHARYLASAITNFPKLINQCYKHTKPGGWVEFQDWDLNLSSDDGTIKDTSLEKYFSEVLGSFEGAGYETRPGHYLKRWITDAGFEDVQIRPFKVPMGIWPKDRHYKKVGAWALLVSEQGLEAGAMAVLTRYQKRTLAEVTSLVEKTKLDLRNPRIHAHLTFYVAYGRKPEKS